MRSRRFTDAALALAVLLVATSPARAADTVESLNTHAIKLYGKGEYAATVEVLKKAYDLYPDPLFLYSISTCLVKLGDKVGALETVERYLGTKHAGPERALAVERAGVLHVALGLAAEEAGDCAKALRHFERARALSSSDEAMLHSATCLEALGRKAEARAIYEKTVGLGGDVAPDLRALAEERLRAFDRERAAGAAKRRRTIWIAGGVIGGGLAVVVVTVVVVVVVSARPRPVWNEATLDAVLVRF